MMEEPGRKRQRSDDGQSSPSSRVGGAKNNDENAAAEHAGTNGLLRRQCYPDLKLTIVPTDKEQELFDVLKGVLKQFKLKTEVYVAGGWVRDKLLGHESNDIDIALNDMTGEAFAKKVNQYLTEQGKETHRIGVVMANPMQSKHLETAMLNVLGLHIDFVNLRSEEYQDTSRIPTVNFGSAKDDAVRRDFTINSMFYNVNKSCLEDLTGLGMADLKQGVVRTPLPPTQTFKDDPLRMLRAVRFASRYGFVLHDSVVSALRDSENLAGLQTKVSRERVGAELTNMLNGADPGYALDLLLDNGLMPLVFSLHDPPPAANQHDENIAHKKNNAKPKMPGDLKKLNVYLTAEAKEEEERRTRAAQRASQEALDHFDWRKRVSTAKELLAIVQTGTAFGVEQAKAVRAKDITPEMVLLAGLLHGTGELQALNIKHKLDSFVPVLVRDSLKVKFSTADCVKAVVQAAPELLCLAVQLVGNVEVNNVEKLRGEVGRLMLQYKEMFHVALCLAAVSAENSKVRSVLEVLCEKALAPDQWGLSQIWKEMPPVNGKELIKELALGKGGPIISVFTSLQNDWIVANRTQSFFPNVAQRRLKCLEFLKSNKANALEMEADRASKAKLAKERVAEERRLLKEHARKIRNEEGLALKVKEGINE